MFVRGHAIAKLLQCEHLGTMVASGTFALDWTRCNLPSVTRKLITQDCCGAPLQVARDLALNPIQRSVDKARPTHSKEMFESLSTFGGHLTFSKMCQRSMQTSARNRASITMGVAALETTAIGSLGSLDTYDREPSSSSEGASTSGSEASEMKQKVCLQDANSGSIFPFRRRNISHRRLCTITNFIHIPAHLVALSSIAKS